MINIRNFTVYLCVTTAGVLILLGIIKLIQFAFSGWAITGGTILIISFIMALIDEGMNEPKYPNKK